MLILNQSAAMIENDYTCRFQSTYTNCICFLFAGVCVITISALQALGKGLPSLLISLIRQIAVILPLSYILAINFGLVALFWAFPVAEFIAMVISIFLFRNAYIKLIKPLGEKPTETLRSPTE